MQAHGESADVPRTFVPHGFAWGCRGQNDIGTQSASTSGKQDTTQPHWREAFHLCVGNMEQILEIVVAHAAGTGRLGP